MRASTARVCRGAADFLAWWALAGVVVLPALSYAGYPVSSLEYCLSVVAAAVFAAICCLVGRIKVIGKVLLLLLAAAVVLIYFAHVIEESLLLTVFSASAGLAIAMATWFDFRASLWIVGLASAAQVVTIAAISTTPSDTVREQPGTMESSRPSVVHVILDEHAGTASIPDDAVSEDDRRNLESFYVNRGFVVFRRAYSADRDTPQSIARLLNPGIANLNEALGRPTDHHRWLVTKAEAIRKISKDRTIVASYFDYLTWDDQIIAENAIRRVTTVNGSVSFPFIAHVNLSALDRTAVAYSEALGWLYSRAHSPLLVNFFSGTAIGRRIWGRLDPKRKTQPIISRYYLREFTRYLKCCGKQGTYYYIHNLIPHYPFIFDSACRARPVRDWLDRFVNIGEKNTLATRRLRYRLHFAQAQCVAQDIGALVDAVDSNERLRGAVILVHSDHGSRIAIEDRQSAIASGYDRMAYQQDWRGAFFAVRIPGVPGRLVERPARIDLIYQALLSNDFRTLDPKSIPKTGDSPYPGGLNLCEGGNGMKLTPPFRHEAGQAYQAMLPDLENQADNAEQSSRSEALLCEDGKPLGPSHSLHDTIRKFGDGGFSHWNDYLLFSSSDSSDPNTNGRTYMLVTPGR